MAKKGASFDLKLFVGRGKKKGGKQNIFFGAWRFDFGWIPLFSGLILADRRLVKGVLSGRS
jgi:hypothetical protein